MDSDSEITCQKAHNVCKQHDIENNITNPDFDHGCWNSFLEMCLATERPTNKAASEIYIPLILIAVLSIGTNSLVCIVFCLYRQLRLARRYFVINLAVTDIVIAAVLIPLFVAARLTTDSIACRCQIVLDIACGTVSLLCLAFISLERYVTLTIIMGTHFVCWCPLFVFFLVYSYCPTCRGDTMRVVNYVILFLRHFNSFSNPVIYCGINKQFRAAIKRFVLRRSESIEELQTKAAKRS